MATRNKTTERQKPPRAKSANTSRSKANVESRARASKADDFAAAHVVNRFRFETDLFEQITGALIDSFADLPSPPSREDISLRVHATRDQVIKHFDSVLGTMKLAADAGETILEPIEPAKRNDPSALPRAVMQFMWAAFPSQLPPTRELTRAILKLHQLSTKQIAMLREALTVGFANLESALLKAASEHTPLRSAKALYELVSRGFEAALEETYRHKPYADLIAELANQYGTVYELSRANSAPLLQALGLPSATDTQSLTTEIAALRQAVDKLTQQSDAKPSKPKQQKKK